MADVVNLAKLRAESLGDQGAFKIFAVDNGEHVQVQWENKTEALVVLLTLDETQNLVDQLQRAIFTTKQIARKVFGFVSLAWCDTKGEPVTESYVRGRIVRRTQIIDAAGVEVVIEPEEWQRETRHGWPQAGLYGLDGWPMARDPKRRNWRIVSGLPTREATDHAR